MHRPHAHLPERPSPVGKPVSLFVTCIADALFPQTGISVVRLLEHLGLTVRFPLAQTCCGQPAFNSGYWQEARQVARQFLRAFDDAEVVVAPSGSCVAMVRHEYPRLFEGDPDLPRAERLASITWEFTEFIVDGLGIEDLGLRLPARRTFAFHDACHGLRILGLRSAARALLGRVENAIIEDLPNEEECCGFGGLFSVKMPAISGAILQRKVDAIEACRADTIVLGDLSCMMQINGGLARHGSRKRARHIADVLAEGLEAGVEDGR